MNDEKTLREGTVSNIGGLNTNTSSNGPDDQHEKLDLDQPRHGVSKRFYRGLWGVLTRLFRVPEHPPTLPTSDQSGCESFKPALGYLKYLRLKFWFWLVVATIFFFTGIGFLWFAPFITSWLGAVAWPIALALEVIPSAIGYLAIHLQYDATWYVLNDRSLRIRRGIWVIRETTITFENVQNVRVSQGPIQRYFGISNVLVETAGGGGGSDEDGGKLHQGLIEGVADAYYIRNLIMSRLKQSRTAGLGDDHPDDAHPTFGWSPDHIRMLGEIRDHARALATGS